MMRYVSSRLFFCQLVVHAMMPCIRSWINCFWHPACIWQFVSVLKLQRIGTDASHLLACLPEMRTHTCRICVPACDPTLHFHLCLADTHIVPTLQVKKLSAKRITSPLIFDNLKNSVPGGLYDPALGPIDFRGRCTTCQLGHNTCPGHFGHIELPVPVYNPLIFGWVEGGSVCLCSCGRRAVLLWDQRGVVRMTVEEVCFLPKGHAAG